MEIKPCPFCSSTFLSIHGQHDFSWVECGECQSKGPPVLSICNEEEIFDAWNERK